MGEAEWWRDRWSEPCQEKVLGGKKGCGYFLQELWAHQLSSAEEGETWHVKEYGYRVNTSVTLWAAFKNTEKANLYGLLNNYSMCIYCTDFQPHFNALNSCHDCPETKKKIPKVQKTAVASIACNMYVVQKHKKTLLQNEMQYFALWARYVKWITVMQHHICQKQKQ